MIFWTWARGLEDEFDSKNRKNPRHFLVSRPTSARPQSPLGELEKDTTCADEDGDDPSILEMNAVPTLPGLTHRNVPTSNNDEDTRMANALTFVNDTNHEEMDVVRIPTCAVFHKITAGRGVPHSFYGFVKQVPALPRLVVSV
jgi:KUP system potassium uptake protein